MRASRVCQILASAMMASLALGGSAQAALVVRNAATQNVSCSAGICTATAGRAVMSVSDLTSMLASSNVTLVSANRAKDIKVAANLSWASTSRLTLDSYRSILVNRQVTVAGTGALTLTTNDGGSGGVLSFTAPGRVAFWDLSSSLIINGASYTLENNIATLASAIAANPSGHFALANNYDASVDGTYAHAPIATTFAGTFEGLGNAVSKLAILNSDKGAQVGLFASLTAGGTLRDLALVMANIASAYSVARTGALVGVSRGTVLQCYSEGTVTATRASASYIGGLVGENDGTISFSHSGATVKGGLNASGNMAFIGGLAGVSSGTISDSYASGSVSQTNLSYNSYIGGLVGNQDGTILRSYATGAVKHAYGAGGLVGGEYLGTISQSHSTGAVSDAIVAGGLVGGSGDSLIDGSYASGTISGNYAGGLVGRNSGSITNSHSTGAVSGTPYAGGLVAENSTFHAQGGLISQSFASGPVSGGDNAWVGGLVGYDGAAASGDPGGTVERSFAIGQVTGGNGAYAGGLVAAIVAGTVEDSYAEGAVSAGTNSRVGGLVGSNGFDASNLGSIQTSYSTGQVSAGAGSSIGGLLGYQTANAGSVGNSYWDLDTSGISNPSQGAGNVANDPGITGLTDAQLKSGLPAGFDPSIWAENPSINGGLPYLIANPPPP